MKLISLLTLVFLTGCTSLFYQPDRMLYSRPDRLKIKYKDVFFDSKDKTRLHGWYLYNKENLNRPKGLVVFFHGNAQNLSSHYVSVGWMTQHGYDVLVWDYRGYGLSQGEPEPKGVYEDSIAALDYALKRYIEGGHKQLIFMGQSLGGNILMRAFKDFPKKEQVDLLVLDSTFLSYSAMAKDKMKSMWLTWPLHPLAGVLFSDKYSPKDYVASITNPALIIHGRIDNIVPYRFGHEIHEKIGSPKKWFWKIDEGRHIDSFHAHDLRYRKELIKLLETL